MINTKLGFIIIMILPPYKNKIYTDLVKECLSGGQFPTYLFYWIKN